MEEDKTKDQTKTNARSLWHFPYSGRNPSRDDIKIKRSWLIMIMIKHDDSMTMQASWVSSSVSQRGATTGSGRAPLVVP